MLLSEVIVETTLSQADALPGKKLAGRTEARASLSSSRRMLRVEQLLQNQLTQSPSLHYIDG